MDQVSLADLIEAPIELSWNEALAIVQELCDVVLDGGSPVTFDPDTTVIHSSGEVSSVTRTTDDPGEAVQAAGALLGSWLADTPYPMPLRQIVTQATSTPPTYATVRELSTALRFYERPNRRELIRASFEKCQRLRSSQPIFEFAREPSAGGGWRELQTISHGARANADELVRSVSEPLRGKAPAGEQGAASALAGSLEAPSSALEPLVLSPETPTRPSSWVAAWETLWNHARRRWNPRAAALSAGILIVVVMVGLYGPGAARSTAGAVIGVQRGVTSTVGSAHDMVLDQLGSVLGGALNWAGTTSTKRASSPVRPEATPAVGGESRGPEPDRVPAQSRTSTGNRTPDSSSALAPATVEQSGHGLPAIGNVVGLRSNGAGAPGVPAGDTTRTPQPGSADKVGEAIQQVINRMSVTEYPEPIIYSRVDTDVIPPIALYPKLPTSIPPGTNEHDLTYLELTIDEGGLVETARVARPPDTLNKAMVATTNLAALKTWRFAPALKDGKAVKYRRTVWVETH